MMVIRREGYESSGMGVNEGLRWAYLIRNGKNFDTIYSIAYMTFFKL